MDKATAKDFNLDEDTPEDFIEALSDVKAKIHDEIEKNQNAPAETLEANLFCIFRNFAADIIEKANIYQNLTYVIEDITTQKFEQQIAEEKNKITAEKSEKASKSIQQRWDNNPQRNAEIAQTINIAKGILSTSQRKHTLSSLESAIRNYCARNDIEHMKTPQTYKDYIKEDTEIMQQLDCKRLKK